MKYLLFISLLFSMTACPFGEEPLSLPTPSKPKTKQSVTEAKNPTAIGSQTCRLAKIEVENAGKTTTTTYQYDKNGVRLLPNYTYNDAGFVIANTGNGLTFFYDKAGNISSAQWFIGGALWSNEKYENGIYKEAIRAGDGSLRAKREGDAYVQYTLAGSYIKQFYDTNGSRYKTEDYDRTGRLTASTNATYEYSDKTNPLFVKFKGLASFDHAGWLSNSGEPAYLLTKSVINGITYTYTYQFNSLGLPLTGTRSGSDGSKVVTKYFYEGCEHVN